jgi:hypothetical protein
MAFDRIDPIGDIRADLRTASLCQMVAAVAGDGRPTKLSDFLLRFGEAESPKPKPVAITGDRLKMLLVMGGETVIDTRPDHGGSR